MAVKTAYKPKKEFPAENIPTVEIDGVEAEPVAALSAEVSPELEPAEAESEAVREYEKEVAKADAASLALKRQIEALRRSEEIQRQQAAQLAAQRPPTREEKLAMWRQQGGMHDAELRFLEANPELIDIPQLTAFAANEALKAGHERGSEAHMETTKKLFHEYLASMQAPAATPDFFKPLPAKAPPDRSSRITSAPVSREVPSGGPRPETNPDKVILSAEEMEIARSSGISAAEYARHKIRLQREKAAGIRQ